MGSRLTRGMVMLRNAGRQVDIAGKLGVAQGTVSFWTNGRKKPGYSNRKGMLDKLGIPLEAWDEPVVRIQLAEGVAA